MKNKTRIRVLMATIVVLTIIIAFGLEQKELISKVTEVFNLTRGIAKESKVFIVDPLAHEAYELDIDNLEKPTQQTVALKGDSPYVFFLPEQNKLLTLETADEPKASSLKIRDANSYQVLESLVIKELMKYPGIYTPFVSVAKDGPALYVGKTKHLSNDNYLYWTEEYNLRDLKQPPKFLNTNNHQQTAIVKGLANKKAIVWDGKNELYLFNPEDAKPGQELALLAKMKVDHASATETAGGELAFKNLYSANVKGIVASPEGELLYFIKDRQGGGLAEIGRLMVTPFKIESTTSVSLPDNWQLDGLNKLSVSPDGNWLYVGVGPFSTLSEGVATEIWVFNSKTLKVQSKIKPPNGASAFNLTLDGTRLLALNYQSKTLAIIDVSNLTQPVIKRIIYNIGQQPQWIETGLR